MAANKRAEQRRQQATLSRIGSKYERRIAYEIARAMRAASIAYGNSEPMAVQSIMSKHQDNMQRLLSALWRDGALTFSERMLGLAKNHRKMERKAVYDVVATEIADSVMSDWLRSTGLQKITQITSTTKDDIERVISEGISDGLGEKEIANLIKITAPNKSASRSQTIARTEAHGAANYAANETAKAMDVEFKREWVSAETERSRDSHIAADGQTVGMYEAFKVGGYKLMTPGDSSLGAPAKEVINCMCSVVFIPV